MTPAEFTRDVLPVVESLWPRYKANAARVEAICDGLGRYIVEEVAFQVHQYAKHSPDATKPSWESIGTALSECATERAPRSGWSISDEHTLAWIQEEYRVFLKDVPSVEYIATQQMHHTQAPTEQERRRAQEQIMAAYPEVMRWSPDFMATIEGHNRRLDEMLAEKARIDALAPVQIVNGKRRERPLCDQACPGKLSFDAFLEQVKREQD